MQNSIQHLKNEKIGLCVSGGLDSRTIAKKLKELGIDVVCFVADLAQPDEEDITNVKDRMSACGVETVIVDLQTQMARACIDTIMFQAKYDGEYWNTTGLARAVTVRGLLPEMQKNGCTILAHGATGRGNDQVRFHRYTNVLAPEMKIYAPWRDPVLLKEFPGRKQMIEYLQSRGIEGALESKKRYSTDGNLAGLSHEAEDLESLETPSTIVKPTMAVWPHEAPDEQEKVVISFNCGIPVSINGKNVSPLDTLKMANKIGGRNGIGIRNALENRIVGTKSRGVYEAPGMELLGFCLAQIYQATLDRRSTLLLQNLSKLISDQIYDGRFYDPSTTAAKAGIKILAEHASGEITVNLYKGNIYFQSLRNCYSSLYNEADSSMEESTGLNPESSQGFVEVQSVEAIRLANANQIHD